MRLTLGFALVVGALAVGCGDDSGGGGSSGSTSGSTGGTTGAATPGSSTTSGGTTGAVDSSSGSSGGGSSTDGGSSSSSGGETTEGTTEGSSDSGSSSSGGGELNENCIAGCETQVMCAMNWPTVDDCAMACDANLDKAEVFSPFCRAAWEGVSECLGTLTCEEYEQWESPMAFPYPCSDADVALEVECEGQ